MKLKNDIGSKQIFLLDEPDSHINPKIVNEIFRLIKNELIETLEMQIIMTTHLPTTLLSDLEIKDILLLQDNTLEKIKADSASINLY